MFLILLSQLLFILPNIEPVIWNTCQITNRYVIGKMSVKIVNTNPRICVNGYIFTSWRGVGQNESEQARGYHTSQHIYTLILIYTY